MDSAVFERLVALSNAGRHEDAAREALALAAGAADAGDRASLLGGAVREYIILGRLAEARKVADQLLGMDAPDPEVRAHAEFHHASLLLEEGRAEEGLTAFASTLRAYEDVLKRPWLRYLYEEIQSRRGMALVGLRRFSEALPILKEATAFSFEEPEEGQRICFALAECLSHTGDEEFARQAFNRVIGFGLSNPTEERARYRVARLCFAARGFAQARQQLETILRDFPAESAVVPRRYVYEQLSAACRYLGDSEAAKGYMELSKKL